MTECKVICTDCHTKKTWRWLCETCAQDCLDNHRRQTGHTNLELRVNESFTTDTARARTNRLRAHRTAKRGGWI
jgi:hypothetical protein